MQKKVVPRSLPFVLNYRMEVFLYNKLLNNQIKRGVFMKLSGAEITIKLLERQGITDIPGIPGGQIFPCMMPYTLVASIIFWQGMSREQPL